MEVVTLTREANTARLTFQRQDKPVNVLDEPTIETLEKHLDVLEREPPEVLLLESGLAGCFIAGADLDIIARVDDPVKATRLAERGQALCRRIEVLPSISVAVVQGACMGGGLEMALACDHIVAVYGERTRLALPEIKIGIHPGFGGCIRLPKRVGWPMAIQMIMTGKEVDAARARKIGLAAIACYPEQVSDALALLATRGKKKPVGVRPWWMRLWPAKAVFFQQVEKRAMARLKHLDVEQAYPAVPATLRLLRQIVGASDGVAYALEAESLGRLAVTSTCKNLIRVFHLGQALQKQEAAKRGREAAADIHKTAVYGAGTMGSGIAWVAAKTTEVDVHEVSEAAMSRGMKALGKLARRDPKRLARIRPVLDASGLQDVDVVIEAVLEDLKVKNALWTELEKQVPEKTLLLTNTSSLSVSDMQKRRKHPGRIAGLHFFNPAPKMPLVEVVAGRRTTARTVDTVTALAVGWGKYPIIVSDSPGFLVNRCLMPFMSAALKLIDAGQKPEHVDGALKCFGMPMGAIELADRVGLDICAHVGSHLSEAFGDRFSIPSWFSRMVKDGLLGEKSGAGFFRYKNGKQGEINPDLSKYLPAVGRESDSAADIDINAPAPLSDSEILDACLLPMLVEALACLREKVIEEPVHVDAAFVYGIGFPPFRGGLLRHFSQYKKAELRQKISDLGLEIPENLEVLDAFH